MTITTADITGQPQNIGFRSVLTYVGNERSLRRAFWIHRRNRVDTLFSGPTSEEDERTALRVLLKADSGAECRYYIDFLKWGRLDDELVEAQVTDWAHHVGVQHAQDANLVARFVRWSVGDTTDIPLRDQRERYRNVWQGLSIGRRRQIASWLVAERARLIACGARMEFIGRPSRLESFHAIVEVANEDDAIRSDDLLFVQWQAFYASRFAEQLRDGQVRLLVTTLQDLIDPDLPDIRRHALFDLYQNLFLGTIEAIRLAIVALGSTDQRLRFDRFLELRRRFTEEFPETEPTPTEIEELARDIDAVRASLDGIATALAAAGDAVAGITFAALLNELEDDEARDAINELGEAGRLEALPLPMRVELCQRCLLGTTDDDDEQAINRVIRNTWPQSLCERYLLVSALTWEALSFSIDGDESDELDTLLSSV